MKVSAEPRPFSHNTTVSSRTPPALLDFSAPAAVAPRPAIRRFGALGSSEAAMGVPDAATKDRGADALEAMKVTEIPPLPVGVQVDEDGKLCLHMPGCGGLFAYAYGVCGALQDSIDVHAVRYATTSGSTPALATVLFNAPARPTLELFERRKGALLKQHGARIYWPTDMFIHMAATHNYQVSQLFGKQGGWIDWALANHRVMVVRKPTSERMYLTNFPTLRDYVSACGASCSFPGLPSAFCSPEWQVGRKYGPFADGEITPGSPPVKAFGPRLSIPLEGSVSMGNFFLGAFFRVCCLIMGLLGTKLSARMYRSGYEDAKRLLIPALLSRHVPPPPAGQRQSNGTPAERAALEALPIGFAQPHDMAEPFLGRCATSSKM